MSLKQRGIDEVPEETAEVARAAFPKGNVYMRMRDELGTLYEDDDFAALFPRRGQPAEAPWRLALVTVMQFAENLTDRQAAEAVRGRIDWKYALGLELTDAGFDFSVLSEFRTRLPAGSAEAQLWEVMLARFAERKLLNAQGRQRTDSTPILAAVQALTRVEVAGETLRHALNRLAVEVPAWRKAWVPADWVDRYAAQLHDDRLPKGETEHRAFVETIGHDGYQVLEAVDAETAPPGLRGLVESEILRQVWMQSFYVDNGQVRWRTPGNLPPAAQMLSSPHDLEARYAAKRDTAWIGYKVHLTETCETEYPNRITHVETTPATMPDVQVVGTIHDELAAHNRTPSLHSVDTGYVEADGLVDSQTRHGIDLLGPTMPDTSWQARAGQGFDVAHVQVDGEAQRVICPPGHTSQSWTPALDQPQRPVVYVRFSPVVCRACPCQALCPRAKSGARELTLWPPAQHAALQAARQRQQTDQFKADYAIRAGIEGTISQAAYSLGMRRARYIGLAKTHLQHLATAAAINLARVMAWRAGTPRSQARRSPFAALAA